ncbi:thioredoxin domain-containing protein [Jiulongibacter sediminis]|jgi:thioredoxin-related protein|uniref:thioredoxin family protein n=1 Tax=Jiulongibacter sediminis TaxID=1605367 RepID=UPI0026EA5315|nr:thioredoxin domain-containing protein [Jiulongibacter sediminis]
MKKTLVLSLLLSFFAFGSFAQQGISFEHDANWASVVAKAKKENKLIFMDAYTSWCGPCKMLQAKVFPDKELGKYFNETFVSAKFDMEKGEGPTLAQKFGVRAYPTLYFIDPNTQKVVHQVLGYRSVDQLLAIGKVAQTKKDESSSR